MGPFKRKAQEVVEEVVVAAPEGMSALALFFIGFLFVWYGATVVAFMYQESKVGWKKITRWARNLMFVFAMLAGSTLMIVPSLLVYLVGGTKKGMHFSCYCMRTYFKLMGPILWGPFTFEGTENLPDGLTPTIYCANHQSSVDFCTIFCLPNGPPAVSVAKSSMMFLPGFGQMISLMGGIMVSRGKKGTLAMLLEIGVKRLKSDLSVGIFPQGTRTVPVKGKPLKSFKIGGFKLAVEAQVGVVPFTIIYPDDFMCSAGAPPGVKVIIHPRVEPGDDADKLMAKVEKMVLDPLMKETGALAPVPYVPKKKPEAKKGD